MTKYRLLRELTYPADPRARVLRPGAARKTNPAGAVVDDLPAASIPWLLAKGWIDQVDDEEGDAHGEVRV